MIRIPLFIATLLGGASAARPWAISMLLLSFLYGCGDASQEAPGEEGAECQVFVRTTLQEVDRASDLLIREALVSEALVELGEAPPPRCERDLLLELLDIQESVGSTDKLIRTAERLLSLGPVLSQDQTARVKLKLAEAYFTFGIPRSFDLAKDVFLHWDSMGVRSLKMFQVTSLLVRTYDLTGDLEECSMLLKGALEKARDQDDPLWTAELLDRLGDLSARQQKTEEALAYQREGLSLLDRFRYRGQTRDTLLQRSMGASEEVASSGRTQAGSLSELDRTPRLLTIRDQLLMRLRLRHHMGETFLATQRIDSAKSAFRDALAIAIGPLGSTVEAPYVELGELLLADGATDEAIAHGRSGLDFARNAGDPGTTRRAAELLYRAYKARRDLQNALSMYELAQAYGDSIGDESFSMGLLKKQILYEVREDSLRMTNALSREQLERENAQLEARSNRTMALAVGGVGMLILAGSGVWFYTDRRRRRERFERESAQLETQALRSQMNPHFIFNALNSINAYVQQNDQDSASSYLTKFARVMRAVLENSRHTEVSLSEDLDALRGYMELERMRMQHKFDFSIDVAPDIDPDDVVVPPLVVQPFVENAIWHGMARKEGKGYIALKVSQRQGQLIWTIEDDGVGRNSPQLEVEDRSVNGEHSGKKTSLGTAITRARLDLVEKQHGGKAGFRYIDLEQGTRVEVDMPLMRA